MLTSLVMAFSLALAVTLGSSAAARVELALPLPPNGGNLWRRWIRARRNVFPFAILTLKDPDTVFPTMTPLLSHLLVLVS